MIFYQQNNSRYEKKANKKLGFSSGTVSNTLSKYISEKLNVRSRNVRYARVIIANKSKYIHNVNKFYSH